MPHTLISPHEMRVEILVYLDLTGRYFIPWYKIGQQPTIDSASEEALYIFYYKQSKFGSFVTNFSDLDDKVYATALLYQPTNIVLTSGTQSMTFSIVSMAFNPGQRSVLVVRNGAQILSVSLAPCLIASQVSQYNFNVYSNFQTAS